MASKVFTQEQICKDVNTPEITLKKGGTKITSTHAFVFDGKFIVADASVHENTVAAFNVKFVKFNNLVSKQAQKRAYRADKLKFTLAPAH